MERSFRKVSPSKSRLMFVLGGQPGAGKSSSKSIIEQKIPDANYVKVDIDEYRSMHPYAEEIFLEYGKEASAHTHADVGKWGDTVRDEARKRGLNVVVEGTMRTNSVCKTIGDFEQDGYEINIIGVLWIADLEYTNAMKKP